MTRLTSKSDPQRATSQGRVAAVHRQGDAWRLVAARLNAGTLEVIASRSLSAADAAAATAILREHRIETLVHVIPSARSVCRSVQLPEESLSGDAAAVLSALSLQAEADLPVSIPLHRRAAGVVRPGSDSARPIPLLVGWQPGNGADPFAGIDVDTHLYVPEPIALAALAAAPAPAGAGGGAEIAAYADRNEGTVALFASGDPATGGKSIARIARVDNSSASVWGETLRTSVSQLRAAAGLPAASIGPTNTTTALLFAGPAAGTGTPRVTGVSTEPSWREQFGIALGAALVATSSDPLLAVFSKMTPEAPGRSGSPLMRAVTWLAPPKRAGVAIAACLGLLLLWPLGVAAARNWVLTSRSGGASTLVARLDEADRRDAFFELLRSRRWPMTKLLSDISSAAPVGIIMESVELSPESGGAGGVSIRGSSDTRDAIAAFVKNLSDTRIFDDLSTPTIISGTSGESNSFDFRLQARVAGPLLKAAPAEDFAKKPLAERLYGEGATNTFSSAGSSGGMGGRGNGGDFRRGEESGRDRGSRRGDRTNGGGAERGGSRSTAAAEPAPKPGDIPPPISDDQIAKLDRAAALREFTSRNRASTASGLEEATRTRLKEEAAKAKQRMLEATKETPG